MAAASSVSSNDDRQAGGAPLRKTIFQTARLETANTKRRNCFVREDTVRASAVSDDRLCGIELGKARFQFAQWDVHCTRQMPQWEFIPWAHIENRNRPRAQALLQPLARNGLQAVTIMKVAAYNPRDLGDAALGAAAQSPPHAQHCVGAKPGGDEFAVP